jgi:hypothetical protein
MQYFIAIPFYRGAKRGEKPGSLKNKIRSSSFWASSLQNALLNRNNQPMSPFLEQV